MPQYQTSTNLAGDPQITLMQRMAPKPMPLANLKEDIHDAHKNVSWVFGVGDNIDEMILFEKTSYDDETEAWWSCPNSTSAEYPSFRKNVLHPCIGPPGQAACCGIDSISAHAVFKLWFQLKNVKMLMTYEVSCNEGMSVSGEVALYECSHEP